MKKLVTLFIVVAFVLTITMPQPAQAMLEIPVYLAVLAVTTIIAAAARAVKDKVENPTPDYNYQVTPWKDTTMSGYKGGKLKR